MQVSLEAIIFNHDPGAAVADAINIRRNETETVAIPEWGNGVSLLPDDSPAAYAIKAIGSGPITIKAKFKRVDAKITSVEIRAIDPARNPEPLPATEGNAIGEVAERTITFDANGETDFESFELVNVDIHNRGVSSSVATLLWQFRLGASDNWSPLTTTHHRIYTLLDVPKCAWHQQPFDGRNPQIPWTEVLDYACQWATGAKELDEAAGRITQAVFDLGKTLVTYDGPSSYADLTFDLTSLLSLLRDGKGLGQTLNCEDCATIVSTFANALGCDLWQSRIGSSVFTTNRIRLIGEPSFRRVDFNYHEVAWKDECSINDELFDACLQLDSDPKPSETPESPLLAVETIFGTIDPGNYRFRLASLPGTGQRDVCQPTPGKRQRRAIGLNTPPHTVCASELSDMGELHLIQPARDEDPGNGPQIFSGGITLDSWELYRVRFLKRPDLIFGAHGLWFLPHGDPEHLIRLDYRKSLSVEAATREKRRLLDRYQVRNVKQDMDQITKAMDFIIVTSTAFLGQAGTIVVEVRSVGRKKAEAEIRRFARAVSQVITGESH
jgi:hypothetical protein